MAPRCRRRAGNSEFAETRIWFKRRRREVKTPGATPQVGVLIQSQALKARHNQKLEGGSLRQDIRLGLKLFRAFSTALLGRWPRLLHWRAFGAVTRGVSFS